MYFSNDFIIENVLFVPTFTSNLISISKFVNTQFRSVKLKIKVKKIDDLVT